MEHGKEHLAKQLNKLLDFSKNDKNNLSVDFARRKIINLLSKINKKDK